MAGTRVCIAVDDPEFRGVLTALVSSTEGFEVGGILDSLVSAANVRHFDVLVVTENSGIERLAEFSEYTHALVLGTSPDSMLAAVTVGALGYLDAGSALADIVAALITVSKGEGTIPPELLGTLLRQVVTRRRAEREQIERLDVLTKRELQVFELVAKGLDKVAIAESLFISPGTVRTHKQSIFKKLDLHSQAEVVALAVRCGFDLTGGAEDG